MDSKIESNAKTGMLSIQRTRTPGQTAVETVETVEYVTNYIRGANVQKQRVLEKQFEKTFMGKANYLPNSFWLDKNPPTSVRGQSDRIGVINGKFICLEFKASVKEMGHPREKLQRHFIERVLKAGGYGSFVYPENQDIVMDRLREIANG